MITIINSQEYRGLVQKWKQWTTYFNTGVSHLLRLIIVCFNTSFSVNLWIKFMRPKFSTRGPTWQTYVLMWWKYQVGITGGSWRKMSIWNNSNTILGLRFLPKKSQQKYFEITSRLSKYVSNISRIWQTRKQSSTVFLLKTAHLIWPIIVNN